MILHGDCLTMLKTLPDACVQTCVTSPPYWGLRDYGCEGQIGLEPTPDAYVQTMVQVFQEVKRVLKEDGTLWLNLGDSYGGSGKGPDDKQPGVRSYTSPPYVGGGVKPKDLVGIPWRVAFALQADGWYLRSDIIWSKPNPMPESVQDRPTKSHEYLFLLSKRERYYYDAEAIKENIWSEPDRRLRSSTFNKVQQLGHALSSADYVETIGRNKRSVWSIATAPYPEAHFATFPPKLIEPCILAGCPAAVCNQCGTPRESIYKRDVSFHSGSGKAGNKPMGKHEGTAQAESGSYDIRMGPKVSSEFQGYTDCGCNAGFSPGTVLDPFAGAGTTLLVAKELNRKYIGIELNAAYIALAERRLQQEVLALYDAHE